MKEVRLMKEWAAARKPLVRSTAGMSSAAAPSPGGVLARALRMQGP